MVSFPQSPITHLSFPLSEGEFNLSLGLTSFLFSALIDTPRKSSGGFVPFTSYFPKTSHAQNDTPAPPVIPPSIVKPFSLRECAKMFFVKWSFFKASSPDKTISSFIRFSKWKRDSHFPSCIFLRSSKSIVFPCGFLSYLFEKSLFPPL